MRILWSAYREPAANAALEEQLYRGDHDAESTLLFYCNDQAVLFGRNQNPWQECNVSWCLANDLTLMRRLSGGGTVYHDPGNLNYAFIMPRREYDQERHLQMVLAALRQAGVPEMSMSRQFSLWSGQRKVAGTAFALNNRRALLHGCILVHSDLQRLRTALQLPPGWNCQTTGVPSVRAPVTSVAEHQPGLTTRELAKMIAEQATGAKQSGQFEIIDAAALATNDDWQKSRDKFLGFAWNFGRVGDFAVQVSLPPGQLRFQISGGYICHAALHSLSDIIALPILHGLPLTISLEEMLAIVKEAI